MDLTKHLIGKSEGDGIYKAINGVTEAKDEILLLGIDFVLENYNGKLQAVAIDVNPRAVIAHSTLTTNNEEKLGLGMTYWQNVSTHIMKGLK